MPRRKHIASGFVAKRFLALALAGLLVSPTPLLAEEGRCAGVSFPGQIQVAGKTLQRNGIGVRRATIFNVHVYVAALYVERPSRSAAPLLRDDQIRSLTLLFVRDVTREEMVEALEDGIEANAPRGAGSVKQDMKALERILPPLRKGDELTFRHVPGKGLSVLSGRDVVGTIESDAFASLMFRIWLGADPPDDGLKAGLLGGKCG